MNGSGYDTKMNVVYSLENGKGYIKEYFENGYLKFEGEYVNGERNGKGKEYYKDGCLLFEGEYLNGKRWSGKAYNINKEKKYLINDGKGFTKGFFGDFLYVGEFVNGERNGRGKEDIMDILNDFEVFEGEYLNDRKNGKGEEYNISGYLEFEGEYLDDYRRKGKEYHSDNGDYILEFEGEYRYDRKWNGKGYDKNGNIIYELKNGNGKVKEYYFYGDKCNFEGEYLNDERNGKGKEYFFNGHIRFEGEYLNDVRIKGKEYFHKLYN